MTSYAYITSNNECYIKPGQDNFAYISNLSYAMYLVDTSELDKWLSYNTDNNIVIKGYPFNAITVNKKPFAAGFEQIDILEDEAVQENPETT